MFMRKAGFIVAVAGMFALAVGCSSSSDSTTKPVPKPDPVKTEGRVIKGPVLGGTVWADKVKAGKNNEIDDDEKVTQTVTKADGTFTLNVPGGYGDYMVVTTGGEYIGLDGITMVKVTLPMRAKPGSKSVSPLTTVAASMTEEEYKAYAKAQGLVDEDGNLLPADYDYVKAGNTKVMGAAYTIIIAAEAAAVLKIDPSLLFSVASKAMVGGKFDVNAMIEALKNNGITVDANNSALKDAVDKSKKTEDFLNAAIKIAKTTMKVQGQGQVIDTDKEVLLLPNEPHNVDSFIFEVGFTPEGLATIKDTAFRTWDKASLIMEAKNKAADNKQNIKAVISGVKVKVANTGSAPVVTLTYGDATKMTITGTKASGEAINKVEITDDKPAENAIVTVQGKNITVDIAGLKAKIAKVDNAVFQEINGVTFSNNDAYELKFSVGSETEIGLLLDPKVVNVKIVNQK